MKTIKRISALLLTGIVLTGCASGTPAHSETAVDTAAAAESEATATAELEAAAVSEKM